MNQPLKTSSIKLMLTHSTWMDLANLYNPDMECQVIVGQDGGTRIDSDFKGKRGHSYTDGFQTWKPFRIPFNAATDPNYEDSPIAYDLVQHAEGIGMTGWNWKLRVSEWVAYDFDAISGHSESHHKKLEEHEIKEIIDRVSNVPWVTVRKSTSGKGLHLYVFLNSVPTNNHTEHSALARAVLNKLSALVGFNFSDKVDVCGSNMWVWHRKMKGTDGLCVIKKGESLDEIPEDWQNQIIVASGHRQKVLPKEIKDTEEELFMELTGQQQRTILDEDHKLLIKWLEDNNANWWWSSEHNMLVTHTFHLKEAHNQLALRGIFSTLATGKDKGSDHNCFMSPSKNGSWQVRRFSPGTKENDSWTQDGQGWTRCFFNREADLGTVARSVGAIENKKGAYVFSEAESAQKALFDHLKIDLELPSIAADRQTIIKEQMDGRLLVEIEAEVKDTSDKFKGWLLDKKKWQKLVFNPAKTIREIETRNYEDIIRHLVTKNGEDYGWTLKATGWKTEPLTHIKLAMRSLGFPTKDMEGILGAAVLQAWTMVNVPFQPEYLGDRMWNKEAAQLKIVPSDEDVLSYPYWNRILNHCGFNLNAAVLQDDWCIQNNVLTGADYLKLWAASLFQAPQEPLPYLFFYGNQDSGKSIFYEGLSLLMTKGTVRGNLALESPQGFNGELESAILCVVEEMDLKKSKTAYNRLKDLVTGKHFMLHIKGLTPVSVENFTHWCQFGNDISYCPVFPGDTRITVCHVENLKEIIPKRILLAELAKEAPHFLAELLRVDIPTSPSRLNIPVLMTIEKTELMAYNMTILEHFCQTRLFPCNGARMTFHDFVVKFHNYLDPNQVSDWSKQKITRELPSSIMKGHDTKNILYIANVSFNSEEIPSIPWIQTQHGPVVVLERKSL
jgi:hypothetical protein